MQMPQVSLRLKLFGRSWVSGYRLATPLEIQPFVPVETDSCASTVPPRKLEETSGTRSRRPAKCNIAFKSSKFGAN